MTLPPRTIRAVEQLRLTSALPGDVVECGTSSGVTAIALGEYIKRHSLDKKVYACDTFGGLPYDGGKLDADLKAKECYVPYMKWQQSVDDAGLTDIVIPVPGLVENTLKSLVQGKRFCLAFLDMDLYEPTSFAAKVIAPKIVLGGVLGFHDYRFHRCPGIEVVVDKEVNRQVFVMYGDHAGNCAWLQRRRK